MTRKLWLGLAVTLFLAGCTTQPPRIFLRNTDIPVLDMSKSRVYFYYGGKYFSTLKPKIIYQDAVLAWLPRWYDCTYIDFEPGQYKFKAGHDSLGPKEFVTDILLEPDKTYYLEWSWTVDRILGPIFGTMRGGHLRPNEPDEGVKRTRDCFFVKPVTASPEQ